MGNIPGYKRPTEIQILRFPKDNGLIEWLFKIGRIRWAFSQYIDMREPDWIHEVWEKSYEELGDSGEPCSAQMDSLTVMKPATMLPRILEVECSSKRLAAAEKRRHFWDES